VLLVGSNMAEAVSVPSDTRRQSFLHNVIWGWFGVGVNLAIGILLMPVIIRKLGVQQYGLWVLLFSVLDYIRVLDFGFRAAVVNGCARFRARGDWAGVNRTLVTSLGYFAGIGVSCAMLVIAVREPLVGALKIVPEHQGEALRLIVLIAVAVAIRMMMAPLAAVLEAFERFDLVNRGYIAAVLFRSVGSLILLFMGFGLLEMAWTVLAAQIGEAAYVYAKVRRLLPGLDPSPRHVQRETLARLFRYGRYSALIGAANLVTINAPVTVLGYARSAAEVGFFALPFRLLMYSAEGLARVSDVTSSVTAGLDERGETDRVWNLAVLTNRHCFALFMPLAIFLSLYGTQLLRVWVNPEVASHSGPLLPVITLGFLFAIAGQYNAGAVLIGQGKHAVYAYGALVEAVSTIALLLLLVPGYGITGAAWVVSAGLLIGRGAYLAVALCWQNGFHLGRYLWAVYSPGLAAAIPVVTLALVLRQGVWPGATWPELILAGLAIALSYFGIAFFAVLHPEHRHQVLRRLSLV
jgi:O-antigen/teichoic acid export membrane protein